MNNSSVIPFPQRNANNRPESREKLTPQSLEAEQSTLGAMLMERDAVARSVEILTVDDFYRELHKKIFKSVLKLFDKGEPIDIVTVAEDLRRNGMLEEVGGSEYLSALIEACPSSVNVEAYAKVVSEKSVLRQLLRAADQISGMVYADGDEVDGLVDQSEKLIFDINRQKLKTGFTHIKPLLMTAYDQIEKQFQHRGEATGISTGFVDLDDITSGLQPTDLVILAARPSMGKTALCLNIAHHIALKERQPVAVFSLEMSKEQLVQRLICSEASIKSQDLRRGRVQDGDWHRITNAVNNLYQAPIFIDDQPGQGTFEMRAKARRLTAEHGQLGLIVVDYLQLAHSSGKSENRVQEISEIARAFKSMARELKCPLIALSQLSRAVEQREDKRPMLSDLRESGCLTGESLVYLPDAGAYKRIDELEHLSGFRVLAVDDQTGKLEPRVVTRAFSTGIKPVYKLTMASGRTVRATGNHKFLGVGDWKRLDEVEVGSHLALPRQTAAPNNVATMSDAELALLAHLIGDGCTLQKRGSYYTSGEEELARAVVGFAGEVFGDAIRPKISLDSRNRWEVGLVSSTPLTHGKPNAVAKWLRELSAWNKRSWQKLVPARVFAQPEEGVGLFLRHLWATDGCLHLKKCGERLTPFAYYASNSERLARNVQSLLLRLGVQSTLRDVDQKGKGRLMWNVVVTGQSDMRRFIERVGAFGARRTAKLEELRALCATQSENTNRDVIPREVWRELVVPALERNGITTREMQRRINTNYCGAALYKSNLSRERAARVADAVECEKLRALSESDLYWDKVVSIEPDGEEEVYDLTVEGLHSFVANDIVVHNSIEAEADVVAFIYRASYYRRKALVKDGQPAPQGEPDPDEGIAEVIIGKQRNGPVGTIKLGFQPEYARFTNLAVEDYGGGY